MLRRLGVCVLALLILCACGKTDAEEPALSWQEQFELGQRYLSEGKYEEAIIAFQAVIEIDPRNAEAYELLAQVYLELNDGVQALAVLQTGFEATGDAVLEARIQELTAEHVPEGETDEDEPQMNVFGTQVFEQRDMYRTFDELTDGQKELLLAAIPAVEAGDQAELKRLTEQAVEKETEAYLLTTVGAYKAFLDCTIWGNGGGALALELRPENGTGYIASYNLTTEDSGGLREDYHYTVCPCDRWQWNGTTRFYRQVLETGNEQIYEEEGWAEVVDGLRHGAGVERTIFTYPSHTSWQEDAITYESGQEVTQVRTLSDGRTEEIPCEKKEYVYSAHNGSVYPTDMIDRVWW